MSRLRIAGAAHCAALVACLFYAADRTWAAWHSSGFDPLEVVATTRIDYFWRCGVAGFLGSLAFGLWMLFVRHREGRAQAVLARLTPAVVLLCATASVLWP